MKHYGALLYIVVHCGILDNNREHWISVSDSWRPLCSGKCNLLEYIKNKPFCFSGGRHQINIVLVEATIKLWNMSRWILVETTWKHKKNISCWTLPVNLCKLCSGRDHGKMVSGRGHRENAFTRKTAERYWREDTVGNIGEHYGPLGDIVDIV